METTALDQKRQRHGANASPLVPEAANALAVELRALPNTPAPDAVRRRVLVRLDALPSRRAAVRHRLWAGAAAAAVAGLAAALWIQGKAPVNGGPAAVATRGAAPPAEIGGLRLATAVEAPPRHHGTSLIELRARARRVEAKRRATALVFPPSRAEAALIAGIRGLDALAANLGGDVSGRAAQRVLLRQSVELAEGLAELERSRQAALMREAAL